jgi:hypothetical protein
VSHYDPTDLESQDKHRKAQDLKDRLANQSENDDIEWLMKSKRGRRILWRFLDRAGVFRTSFHQNSMTMAFNEGVRNEGLRLLATINVAASEFYQTMVKEANE